MKEIAQRLGVTEAIVSNWERKNIKPYKKTREKLRDFFNLGEKIPI
jgi:transcriptional regulator with XRE-family HTH domain